MKIKEQKENEIWKQKSTFCLFFLFRLLNVRKKFTEKKFQALLPKITRSLFMRVLLWWRAGGSARGGQW
ncbi:hypothetical protein ES288_A10G152300v1 [Gossypium darwinii]|uniref:Uncharacterized protein n=1 Tax=Gossypium darwinii TaxID=34276 RepID=A0A5D2F0W0_GOSDA|nr:hypothetical protein ES288_A10G152300v1 [Gossypium darwinii]